MINKYIFLSIFAIIFCAIPAANAETLIIEGSNEEEGIFIIIDENRNTIILDTIDDPILDSKMKTYHIGAFNLKNSERNISVWVYPFSDTQYRIIVKSSDSVHNIQKIIGTTVVSEENKIITAQRDLFTAYQDMLDQQNEQEEPISDIQKRYAEQLEKAKILEQASRTFQDKIDGLSDLNNGNSTVILQEWKDSKNQTQTIIVDANGTEIIIPNISRDDDKTDPILTITGFERNNRNLNDKLDEIYRVYEVRQAENIVGAEVTLEISRDGFVQKKVTEVTGQGGLVRFEIDDMVYPLFYPNHCYNFEIVATYGNLTATWDDDFIMKYPTGVRVWEATFDWISEVRWNHLPQSYRDEPRQTIWEDTNCT